MKKNIILAIAVVVIIGLVSILLVSKKRKTDTAILKTPTVNRINMQILSPAFEQGKEIPSIYTCDGSNISPPLTFLDISAEVKSLVLIVEDPDAPSGIFVHWLVWNIDPTTKEIAEGSLPNRAIQGKNDFGDTRYGGPCPFSGTHRYQFKLFSLDTNLDLPEGSNKGDLINAMQAHILEETILTANYSKK